MSNLSYSVFYPEVIPYFAGIPEIVALNAIRNSAIEFCERSDWLLYTPSPQTVIAGEDEYDLTLDLPTDTVVARVQSAWYAMMPLIPKTEEDLNKIYNLDWRKQVGSPLYFTHYVPEKMIVVPTPTVTLANGLSTTLVVRPSRASTTCDDSLFERWAEHIAAGARARLHATPAQPYESPTMSDKFSRIFEAGISKAAQMRQKGHTRVSVRVRPPREF